ncbi:PP2C family protein-serine/threonine phosphatase [Saccharothrix variisporea]|uniref:GAF domain-containing protein n=1 Tax=Saccharothrix variisporea TaxID=543527 RepID=A0A495XJT1_9PSEU|nr:GAF domain-containing SpoIIE family protein phosphatase [Saccharothrix variisporea]RKT74781.1 GAF domain-containing protein [Saccharothrix variisporea]
MGDERVSEARLRVLEAITDSTLRELDLDKLFEVLLGRVRDLLSVDTVTVLLTDPGGGQLVARATRGLEEEVFHGVRVPVGSGFAGRVAQTREPVQLSHVDETTVVNPLLWRRGLRALLGVPMVAGGDLVGVVHVGSLVDREFTEEEVDLLRLIADRLAVGVHAHRSRAERDAAAVLQDSLLPGHLPTTEGWGLAARYVPGAGSGVGGDWYDVFALPGGRLGLVIGDVVGHGLAAAVVMGRLRSALRAYALEFDDPAEVLGKLDRKAGHFEHNTMATVAYAVIHTATARMDLSIAGHPRPVLAVPGRDTVLLEGVVDPPIGFTLAVTGRHTTTVELPAGSLVVLYTDGLVERRDEALDRRLEFLRRTVTATPAETACARIMDRLVGNHPAADDIALLAVHRTDPRADRR